MFATAKQETRERVEKFLDKNSSGHSEPSLFSGVTRKAPSKFAVVVKSNLEGKCGSDDHE
jgi:hypothetical protein